MCLLFAAAARGAVSGAANGSSLDDSSFTAADVRHLFSPVEQVLKGI